MLLCLLLLLLLLCYKILIINIRIHKFKVIAICLVSCCYLARAVALFVVGFLLVVAALHLHKADVAFVVVVVPVATVVNESGHIVGFRYRTCHTPYASHTISIARVSRTQQISPVNMTAVVVRIYTCCIVWI